jgi:predicted P-loop ATPase
LTTHYGFRPSKETLLSVVLTETRKRTVHPVKQYLEALTWDGAPRLGLKSPSNAGATDTPYPRSGALPSSRRCVRSDKRVQIRRTLILESPQGALKSGVTDPVSR